MPPTQAGPLTHGLVVPHSISGAKNMKLLFPDKACWGMLPSRTCVGPSNFVTMPITTELVGLGEHAVLHTTSTIPRVLDIHPVLVPRTFVSAEFVLDV